VIYDFDNILIDWLTSTFATIPKKYNKYAKVYEGHQFIRLMIHALKTYLKIIHKRIYGKCEETSGDMQFDSKYSLDIREAL